MNYLAFFRTIVPSITRVIYDHMDYRPLLSETLSQTEGLTGADEVDHVKYSIGPTSKRRRAMDQYRRPRHFSKCRSVGRVCHIDHLHDVD